MLFFDQKDTVRIALTERAIHERRTLTERWAALAPPEAASWDKRAAVAATWLADVDSVLDLGCGLMTLEGYLKPGITYYPSDVIPRDHRTLVYDYNEQLPLPVQPDAVACLGLLTYLFDPAGLLSAISIYSTAVISYCITDAPDAPYQRRANGWVNDFDRATMERMFAEAGWRIARTEMIDGMQRLWLLVQDARDHSASDYQEPSGIIPAGDPNPIN
jgi:hypothetical protein